MKNLQCKFSEYKCFVYREIPGEDSKTGHGSEPERDLRPVETVVGAASGFLDKLERTPHKISLDKQRYEHTTPKGPSIVMQTFTPDDKKNENPRQIYGPDGKLKGAFAHVRFEKDRPIDGLIVLHTVPPPKWEFRIDGNSDAVATVTKNPKFDFEAVDMSKDGAGSVDWLRLRVTVKASSAFLDYVLGQSHDQKQNVASEHPMAVLFRNLTADTPSDDFIMERRNTQMGLPHHGQSGSEDQSDYFANYVLYHDTTQALRPSLSILPPIKT